MACSRLSTAASRPGRASSSSRTAISIVAMSAPNSTTGQDNVCAPRRCPLIDQAATQPSTRPANPAMTARRQRIRIPSSRPPTQAKITTVTSVNSPPSTGTPHKKPGPLTRTANHPGPPTTPRIPVLAMCGGPASKFCMTTARPSPRWAGLSRLVSFELAGQLENGPSVSRVLPALAVHEPSPLPC